MNQVALVTEETVNWISEVSSNLLHPLTVRVVDYSCDMNAPSLEVDSEQHEVSHKSAPSQNFHREEVHCSYRSPMSFQERLPSRHLAAFGCWFNFRIGQNSLDGISTEVVAKIPKCSVQSRIALARVCCGHLNDEFGNVSLCWRSAWTASHRAIVLLGDEIAIPTQ